MTRKNLPGDGPLAGFIFMSKDGSEVSFVLADNLVKLIYENTFSISKKIFLGCRFF
jgi:hypothetical protein